MFRACWHSLCACLLSLLSGVGASYAQGVIMPGLSSDGGPAINAALGSPECVAVDAAGNLFIADTQSHP
jgi:hypothetical protein